MNFPKLHTNDLAQELYTPPEAFALLMRLEHLGGVKASKLLKDLDIKILIPEKRINFITPKMRDGEKVGGSQFHTVWITYGLVSGNKQIIYL